VGVEREMGLRLDNKRCSSVVLFNGRKKKKEKKDQWNRRKRKKVCRWEVLMKICRSFSSPDGEKLLSSKVT
jgi:hypothetical protein